MGVGSGLGVVRGNLLIFFAEELSGLCGSPAYYSAQVVAVRLGDHSEIGVPSEVGEGFERHTGLCQQCSCVAFRSVSMIPSPLVW